MGYKDECSLSLLCAIAGDDCKSDVDTYGGFLLWALLILYTFKILASVCDGHLTSVLEIIVIKFRVSEDVAGATFLAMSSSAPEVFSSLVATFVLVSPSGVGNIVGSALFNLLCIIGVLPLCSKTGPLHIWWYPTCRDACFYAMAVIELYLVIADGEVVAWEASVMVFSYVVYVIYFCFNARILKACGLTAPERNTKEELEYTSEPSETLEHDVENGQAEPASSEGSDKVSPSPTAQKRSSVKSSSIHKSDSNASYSGNGLSSTNSMEFGFRRKPTTAAGRLQRSASAANLEGSQREPRVSTQSVNSFSIPDEKGPKDSTGIPGQGPIINLVRCINGVNLKIPGVDDYKSASPGLKIANVDTSLSKRDIMLEEQPQPDDDPCSPNLSPRDHPSSAPADNEIQLEYPSSKPDNEIQLDYPSTKKVDEELVATSSMGSVTFASAPPEEAVFEVPEETGESSEDNLKEMAPSNDSDDEEPGCCTRYDPSLILIDKTMPNYEWIMTAFAIVVFWVAFYTYFMVDGANRLGCFLDFPHVPMGLIVLAAGTSIPDMMASMSVAAAGCADMAAANAVGSNTFDILVGLGLPWMIRCFSGKQVFVPVDELRESIIILAGALISYLAILALNGWVLNKKIGVFLLSVYSGGIFFVLYRHYTHFADRH